MHLWYNVVKWHFMSSDLPSPNSKVLVLQLYLTLWDPMDYSLPSSSVLGDSPGQNTGVGCHSLLQGIFPTQGPNLGLLHWRQILYHLSHQGSPLQIPNPSLIMRRKHQTNPNLGKFYNKSDLESLKLSRSSKIKNIKETVTAKGGSRRNDDSVQCVKLDRVLEQKKDIRLKLRDSQYTVDCSS